MSDEQTTTSTEHQPLIMGFVSCSTVEQEKQKSRIKKFYDTQGYYSDKGIEFFSEWYKINNDLKCGDYIIINDLTDLSRNCEGLAKRLLVPLKNRVHVEPVNKEHLKLLDWDERLGNIEKLILLFGELGGEERALSGLKQLAKQILQGTES